MTTAAQTRRRHTTAAAHRRCRLQLATVTPSTRHRYGALAAVGLGSVLLHATLTSVAQAVCDGGGRWRGGDGGLARTATTIERRCWGCVSWQRLAPVVTPPPPAPPQCDEAPMLILSLFMMSTLFSISDPDPTRSRPWLPLLLAATAMFLVVGYLVFQEMYEVFVTVYG